MTKQLGEIDITGFDGNTEPQIVAIATKVVWMINESGYLLHGVKFSVQSYHRADGRVVLIVNREE